MDVVFYFQIEQLKEERTVALQQRDRLKRMKPDRDDFLSKLKKDRMSIYKVRNQRCVNF